MTFNPVNTLSDVLSVRRIRNECRTYLTNYTGYISIPRQIYWYFTYYRRAARAGIYRIFIARDSKAQMIGYGAVHRIGEEQLKTDALQKNTAGGVTVEIF